MTKMRPDDPVRRDYSLTPQFTSMRPAFTIVCIAYIILMLLHFLTGAGGLGVSIALLCLAALPVCMYIFAYVSPFSSYRKFIGAMSEDEYIGFGNEYLKGKKYITAKPSDPCVLTVTDKYTVLAANPVKVIKNEDISWAYERVVIDGGREIQFIDIHAGKDFTTFTLENMDSAKSEEILGLLSRVCPNARIGYDEGGNG